MEKGKTKKKKTNKKQGQREKKVIKLNHKNNKLEINH